MRDGILSHPGVVLRRIAIVGRPNVGKSTLLNRMCNSRVSIVEPTAGVTRDRVAVPARITTEDGERWFEVIDTGGIGIVDRDDLGREVEAQVQLAVESADIVLFVVDVTTASTPLDPRSLACAARRCPWSRDQQARERQTSGASTSSGSGPDPNRSRSARAERQRHVGPVRTRRARAAGRR
jgi:GTPase SAR1 family protein